jgi:hypothetical protein
MSVPSREFERRSGKERRHVTIASYWHGALNPRRRDGRRATDRFYPVIDWHSPRVLALVLLILGLSMLDAALTLMLMSQGASEINPIMALFLPHSVGWFVATKLALTSIGASVLVACSRMRLFRLLPGEALLYVVLASYITLVVYELRLLEMAPSPA